MNIEEIIVVKWVDKLKHIFLMQTVLELEVKRFPVKDVKMFNKYHPNGLL